MEEKILSKLNCCKNEIFVMMDDCENWEEVCDEIMRELDDWMLELKCERFK